MVFTTENERKGAVATDNLMTQRDLDWPHAYNIRDLGGLPLQGGGLTKTRAIIRADILHRLTAQGRQQLLDYGVRTIIDLRKPDEVAREPSAVFADPSTAPTYLNIPLQRHNAQVETLMADAASMAELYCLLLDHNQTAVAEIMRAIAAAPPGGVIFHCHAGKDRTGIIAALLLKLAGAEHEAILDDYTASQQRLWPLYEKLAAAAGGEDKVNPHYKPLLDPQTIAAALAYLRSIYGGVQKYLLGGGLTAAEVDHLRKRLVPQKM
ncbi:MAG: tyrosine-protein phosphatase [Candidatus Promineifilaceae bacterium]|nr:tyrosine-protein phosphatase [Candidatus Promineifilaceae bacterium]